MPWHRKAPRWAVNYHQSPERADDLLTKIAESGGSALGVHGDVRDDDAVQAMVEAAHDRLGPIDILVMNAHMDCAIQPFIEQDWTAFSAKLDDEMRAMFFLTRAVLPDMVARRSGSLIAISSLGARQSIPGFSSHCAAKAAMESLMRSLAAELGGYGIRANSVAPGFINTDLTAIFSCQDKREIAARSALGRNGYPDDVAEVVVFLAGDASRFVTGASIPVNGGTLMP